MHKADSTTTFINNLLFLLANETFISSLEEKEANALEMAAKAHEKT
jgi:hypothetical protein